LSKKRNLPSLAYYWFAAWFAVLSLFLNLGLLEKLAVLPIVALILLIAHEHESVASETQELGAELLVRDVVRRYQLDALTGLFNRAAFLEEFRKYLLEPLQDNQFTAVFFLDLDRFKEINDTLGHFVGDRFLITAARRLRECAEGSALVARFGGDEFCMAITVEGRDAAIDLAKQILAKFSEPEMINGYSVWANISIGVVLAAPPRATPEDLLAMADSALYQAKSAGKGRFVLFEPNLPRPPTSDRPLELDLREAAARNQLVLHFQPIMNVRTKKIEAFEALLRWRHPRLGLLQPSQFINLAEASGLIKSVDEWVIREACERARGWQLISGTNLQININLSSLQLRQIDMLPKIIETIERTNLSNGSLLLEISEDCLLTDEQQTIRNLQDLQNLGVRIGIDDFGSGQSSLGSLKFFQADVLKIDGLLIKEINDKRNLALIRAIVELGHGLDMKVTAKGIETEEQLRKVTLLRCDQAQGFYVGKPIDDGECTDLLVSGKIKPSVPARKRVRLEQAS
jgi:diguanylate cyclase (GGDEF)-like protein